MMNKEEYEELCLVDRDTIDYIIHSLRQRDIELDKRLNLQQRIDKAIEYIKKKWYEKNTRNIEDMISLGDWRLDLLEILGGKE